MTTISTLDVLSTTGPDGRASLLLAGVLDAATAPQVRHAVDALAAQGATSLVIDLADLRFVDSAGVCALLDVSSALGGDVVVRDAGDLVHRVLEAATRSGAA
jgi:anti-sigma B factor antagonist